MALEDFIKIADRKYTDLREIGVGGMAVVYKGVAESTGRPVVVKVVRPNNGNGFMDFDEKFRQEARRTCQLQHPNIVKVHDFDASEPVKIVFDYIEGLDLRDVNNLVGSMTDVETLVTMEWICYALEEAHKKGIFHRDISRGNIIISRKSERSMLMDFGVAITEEQYRKMSPEERECVVGVKEYMSPEQKVGGRVDARSDIYSVGRVIVMMLTGRNAEKVDLNQKNIPIEQDILEICRTATKDDPSGRYDSASKLRESIKRSLWKRDVKSVEDVESVLGKLLERAYSSREQLDSRMEQIWQDIQYLSNSLEMSMFAKDSLKMIAAERRDLAKDIFEEELIASMGGSDETLFVSLAKLDALSGLQFEEKYRRIYADKNSSDGSSNWFSQKVSNYLNNKILDWKSCIATLLKIDHSGYKSIISKTEERVDKTIKMYNNEHIFGYDTNIKKFILDGYGRALRMTDLILHQLDPENEKYVDWSRHVKERMKTLDEQIKQEEKNKKKE